MFRNWVQGEGTSVPNRRKGQTRCGVSYGRFPLSAYARLLRFTMLTGSMSTRVKPPPSPETALRNQASVKEHSCMLHGGS